MWDARIAQIAGKQFNRISRAQLTELGMSEKAIGRAVEGGRLIIVGEGVFALSPLLAYDDLGQWMGATLTAPESRLSLGWAGLAWGFWYRPTGLITVTRPGSGGPRRLSGVLAYRSTTVAAESTELNGIPVTTVERTLLDLSRYSSDAALARGVRDAVREQTTLSELAGFVLERSKRRGARRLLGVLKRYSGLPIDRARSGAEVRALEAIRDSKRPMPRLNVRIAGEEADLSWSAIKLIVEIDGGPWHQDVGEDARKEAAWRRAGWTVRRISAEDVYERTHRFLAICPANVPRQGA